MFVFSVKASRRQLISLLICLVVLAGILLAAFLWPVGGAVSTAAPVTAADNPARVAYLQSLGYDVDLAYCEVREVLIPDEFDETFTAYNELQKQAKMDLLPYHGKRLKCWSYRVLGNQSDAGEVLAHLYVYKDAVVGGDISETVMGGRVTGLVPQNVT